MELYWAAGGVAKNAPRRWATNKIASQAADIVLPSAEISPECATLQARAKRSARGLFADFSDGLF
jgi:hypothetical protein